MTWGARGSVSVAIPVHDGARYLAEAVESVRAQTTPRAEALVFDNASTDASREIARDLIGADAVRTAASNGGAIWNFNRAVEECSGEYFAWLAADDRLRPRYVEASLAALAATPDAAACLPAIAFITPDGEPAGGQRDPDLGDADPRVRLRSFLRRPRWTEVYCLYRRSALLASPRFRDAFGADVLLTWWFLLRAPLVVLDETLVEYRVFPGKSLDEMSESLTPGAPQQHMRKLRMWATMWRDAAAPDVDRRTRRVARQELLLALGGRDWLVHNLWDVLLAVRYLRARARFVTRRP